MSRTSWIFVTSLGLLGASAVEAVEPGNGVIVCTPTAPPSVALWAAPSRTPAYEGGYVGGGGSVFHGEPRTVNEGTWGWDYYGCVNLRNIWLQWNHGGRYQGGVGAYQTDGHPVPNVLAMPPVTGAHGDDH